MPVPRSSLVAVLVLVAATLLVAAPWAWDPRVSFLQRDTAFNLVALVHLQDVLLHGADWRSSPLGWPLSDSVALTDWMGAQALLGLPLRVLGATRMHDLLVLMGLFATAWTSHRLAEALTGRGPHTWVAGVVGGLGPVQMAHAQHLNLVHHEVTVGAALLLGGGLVRRRWGWALAGGLLAGGGGQFGAYLGMQTAVVAVVVVVVAALARVGDRRCWAAVILGGLLGAGTLVPVILVYGDFARLHELAFNPADLRREAWDVARTLAPVARAPLHDAAGLVGPVAGEVREAPNPGYLALALALVGVGMTSTGPRWTRWAMMVAVATAAVLALGPEVRWNGQDTGITTPIARLGPSILRSPGRWLAVVHVGVGVWAATGLRPLVARAGRAGWVLGLLVALVAVGEVPRAEVGDLARVDPEPADAALDGVHVGGAVYESVGTGCGVAERKLHTALYTGLPLVGGQYARSFPAIAAVNRIAGSWPSPEARAFFELIDVAVTLEHPPLRPMPAGFADCSLVDRHRVCTLPPSSRAPIPSPYVVSETGTGPVVGMRWAAGMPIAPMTLRCGDVEEATWSGIWTAIAQVRYGARAEFVDVMYARPCAGEAGASIPGGRPLYATADRPWLPVVDGPRGSVAARRLP